MRVTHANKTLYRFISLQAYQKTPLLEAVHYGVLLSGKGLHPFLVYITGSMFSISDATLGTLAASVAYIYSYSLIHDDPSTMDNNDLRQGQPTWHICFGEANAI